MPQADDVPDLIQRLSNGKPLGILATIDEQGKPHLHWLVTLAVDDFPLLFQSNFLSQKQGAAMVQLLETFAKHLSFMTLPPQGKQTTEELPLITRAKQFIDEHQAESLSLDRMAKTFKVSTFYFCKIFKKATGLTFTEYLTQARIERAKNLLLNPEIRVNEIAYSCGFASLNHFNRVFKRMVGKAPTAWRRQSSTS